MAALDSFTLTVPARPEQVPHARHAVTRYLAEVHTPDPPLNDVALVVSEAVSNVINHAYVGRPPGEVRVGLTIEGQELHLTIEDDGKGMVPRADSPGLGLGLPLIATVSERFDTTTLPGEGTRLSVWFRREPASATLPA